MLDDAPPWKLWRFTCEVKRQVVYEVGAAWMPTGTQEEVMTPGKNAKHYLAGTLNLATGEMLHCRGERHGLSVSMWSWITTVFIKPRQWSSG